MDPVTRALTVAAAPTGLKAVDIVTFDPEAKILYLIEGTDYRAADPAPLPESLPDEAAATFRDTLAALAIGKVPAPRSYAALTGALAVARDIVCVLHIEFPVDPLLGRADLSDVFDRVRAIMKHSSLRTKVFTADEAEGWTVRSVDR